MNVEEINGEIASLRKQLLEHPLYKELNSKKAINLFMEQHIYAVWDFMSMVKWLQRKITCTETPWIASKAKGKHQRFINEIVLAEESDEFHNGEIMSHFDMYLEAMRESGADASEALELIKAAKGKKDMPAFLRQRFLPGNVLPFLEFTFTLLQEGKAHKIISAFTFGREDLIPDMFISMVKGLNKREGDLHSLVYYLERHIEIDGGEHGPMALEMVKDFCGKNESKWEEAIQAAKDALQLRIRLWDGIYDTLKMKEEFRLKKMA